MESPPEMPMEVVIADIEEMLQTCDELQVDNIMTLYENLDCEYSEAPNYGCAEPSCRLAIRGICGKDAILPDVLSPSPSAAQDTQRLESELCIDGADRETDDDTAVGTPELLPLFDKSVSSYDMNLYSLPTGVVQDRQLRIDQADQVEIGPPGTGVPLELWAHHQQHVLNMLDNIIDDAMYWRLMFTANSRARKRNDMACMEQCLYRVYKQLKDGSSEYMGHSNSASSYDKTVAVGHVQERDLDCWSEASTLRAGTESDAD